ncbi:MAG: Cold shock protein of CSP family, partial [uncultured Propionibacteriaceae bacterium]
WHKELSSGSTPKKGSALLRLMAGAPTSSCITARSHRPASVRSTRVSASSSPLPRARRAHRRTTSNRS